MVTLSSDFKRQTTKAILSLLAFIALYLFLIGVSVLLTLACVYLGISIIIAKPHLLTLLLGLGIISVGVMILFFLFKFLFQKNTTDLSGYTEINRTEQPKLFEMIDAIVKETGTQFPKKVYLSDQVNASVFYDSAFWSMFLPIKKNLHIGMGLVNSVTSEELRGILAHEFGHFSQKTMKVGSYVYNVNHIIYNMLYENNDYTILAAKWANFSFIITLFVNLSFKIIEGIQ